MISRFLGGCKMLSPDPGDRSRFGLLKVIKIQRHQTHA